LSPRPEKPELRLAPATRRRRPFNDTKVEIYGLLNKVGTRLNSGAWATSVA
jgi:hypothetical protein